MAGAIWMALAPDPTTATRFPDKSKSGFQRDEWNESPRNRSRPGISGKVGVDK
jgi:hypothetical protein